MHHVSIEMKKPTIEQKVLAADFVSVHGAENCGIRTLAQLMWPFQSFGNDDCNREAARFVGSVHTALLKELPHREIEQILKDQDEALSFALLSQQRSDKNPTG